MLTETPKRNLNPGGWLELQEVSLHMANDDNTITLDHSVYKWSHYMLEASKRISQDFDNPLKYRQWIGEADFINMQHVVYKWPSNTLPKDKKHKTLGIWVSCQCTRWFGSLYHGYVYARLEMAAGRGPNIFSRREKRYQG
jgi:hypothetical protein